MSSRSSSIGIAVVESPVTKATVCGRNLCRKGRAERPGWITLNSLPDVREPSRVASVV
jgi:hypothetical protein